MYDAPTCLTNNTNYCYTYLMTKNRQSNDHIAAIRSSNDGLSHLGGLGVLTTA